MITSLSSNQYDTLVAKVGQASPRDRCIVLFMLHAGLRNGEVCKLQIGDLYVDSEIFHSVSIQNGHSRTKSSRIISFSPLLTESLREHMRMRVSRSGEFRPDEPAFITKNQKIRISPKDVQRIVAGHTWAWLGVACTPHSLRHTFATRLMKVASIRVVQQLLGHKTLSSTQVYTHPDSEDRAKAINDAF